MRGQDHPVYSLAVICTDRGQHRRNRLFRVAWFVDDAGAEAMHSGPVSANLQPPAPDARPGEGSRASYRLTCPSCSRTPIIAADRFVAIMQGARAAGLHALDMSRLE